MSGECTQYRDRFSEYLDGRLEEGRRRELEAHLEQCPACRAEIEALRRTVEVLGKLPARSAPDGFAEQVKARIRQQAPAGGRRVMSLLLTRALPVAAMFLLVIGLTFMTHRNGLFREPAATAPRMDEMRAEAVAPAEEGAIMQDLPARPEGAPAAPAEMMGRAREMMDSIEKMESRMLKSMEAEAAREPGQTFVFRQVTRPPARPQQILNVEAGDVTDVLRQAVLLANRAGVQAELALHGKEGVDIFLTVPPERYDALLRSLASLTEPHRQKLSNTAIARDRFFKLAATNYRRYQSVAHDEASYGVTNGRPRPGRAAPAAFEEMGARAMMTETPAHPPEAPAAAAEALPALRPTGPVSLRIAIRPVAME
ncbi:MAG: zf-HC2 domain-containing protein [Candidatus Brocadiia bacterium]